MGDPARELADPRVAASSLPGALPYWAVVHDALLLRDGSYELGFVAALPHLDTMSDTELEVLHRRLMRFVEAVPAEERMRLTYVRAPASASVVDEFARVGGGGDDPRTRLHRHRLRTLREAVATGQVVTRELLISVTHHPPRTRPNGRWLVAALLGAAVAVFVGLAARWLAGLIAGAAVGYGALWLSGTRVPKPFTPIPETELAKDGREIAALRARLLAVMEAAGLKPRPLREDEYLQWAWRHFNPGRAAGVCPVCS